MHDSLAIHEFPHRRCTASNLVCLSLIFRFSRVCRSPFDFGSMIFSYSPTTRHYAFINFHTNRKIPQNPQNGGFFLPVSLEKFPLRYKSYLMGYEPTRLPTGSRFQYTWTLPTIFFATPSVLDNHLFKDESFTLLINWRLISFTFLPMIHIDTLHPSIWIVGQFKNHLM